MALKTYVPPPSLDFFELIELLEEKHGWRLTDMAGKHSKEASEERKAKVAEWLTNNGYKGKQYVLDKPEGSLEDWPKDSEEMALRIKINTELRSSLEKIERSYQNVWHYLLDHDFCEFRRGGYNYMYFEGLESEQVPDYVKKVYKAILEEVQDSPAYDGERVCFFIDW